MLQLRSLFKDAAIYGIGDTLARFIGIVTAPILTRIFTPSDYGVIALLQAAIGFFSLIAGLNLISAVYRYYFEYEDEELKKKILSTSLFFFTVVAAICAVCIWFGAPFIEKILLLRSKGTTLLVNTYDYQTYLQILAIGLFFLMLDTYFSAIFRMQRRPLMYTVLNIIKIFANLILIIVLVVYLRKGIEGALWSGVISSIIVCSIGFILTMKCYSLTFSLGSLLLLFSYSLPQFPSVFINWGISQSNLFFINYYATLTHQGYYAIALRVTSIFLVCSVAFRLAWDPFALSMMHNENAKTIYSQGYTFYILFFSFVGGTIALFGKPLLILLTPETYHVSYSIVFILVFGFVYQGSNNVLAVGISISKRTKFISYAQMIALIVNVVLNFILVPVFNAWGAAIAFAMACMVQSFAYYYFAQKLYPINYDFMRLQLFIFIVSLSVLIETILIQHYMFWQSMFVAMIFFIVLLALVWVLGLISSQRKQILCYFKENMI